MTTRAKKVRVQIKLSFQKRLKSMAKNQEKSLFEVLDGVLQDYFLK